ncbi:polysaccharide biosynthesis C-terminal domain-containing protein [Pontimicrobium sp. IMCC45349]|uniref:polysaccharide biosynthesis C-terminal domain-containing protein n=1 Tax=Pontimicrobium sp. IMCC45349 TaxID=3391574 RepID=UPI0039A23923
MGVVQNQSLKNTIITYLGFGIGAINVLFLYTKFLPNNYHGLAAFVLSTAHVMMPILALGVHNTLIKFYSSFKTRNNVNSFLTLMLILPLFIIIPLGIIGYVSYDFIVAFVSKKNAIIEDYVWLIFAAAVFLSYFEVFYAWAKVQLQSVFGNFMKEVFHRITTMILILGIYLELITLDQFIYGLVVAYGLRTIIMLFYAFSIRRPIIRFGKVPELSKIIKYTLLIIIAGSVGSIILEIDKFMIGEFLVIENVAFYGVAIYIASVIGVPARSMHQIVNPITAKLLNENNTKELAILYKKSSLNLFVISGLIFLLIILNINELYNIIPSEYSGALMVVLLVSLAKLSDNIIGNNNAILFNSDYYRVVLVLGAFLAITTVVLNILLIPKYGINGAAIATFTSIVVYNLAKVAFVYLKFKMTPFSAETFKTIILITFIGGLFYFWEFPFHAFVNIALKSLLIALCYTLVIYRLNFSEDISKLINKVIKR